MPDARDWSAVPVESLGWSTRVKAFLARRGVKTVADLCALSDLELLSHSSFGETTIREVREKLAAHGLRLREHEPLHPRRHEPWSFGPRTSCGRDGNSALPEVSPPNPPPSPPST
jgi:DNA-directed RNA polymerase alpha subunit